jgi:FHS family Na+ dependent glucose MFS transporter 1
MRTEATMRTRTAQTISYFGAFLVFGMGVAALGPALPSLAGQSGSTLSRISLIFATAAAGYLLGSLAAGRLFDRLPGHWVLAGVLALMAGMAALIPIAGSLWLLTLIFFFFGIAQGIVEVGCNTLLLWVHTDHAGPFMNALHFFFGVGALLAPLGIALANSATGHLAWFFWLFALLVLPVAVWLLLLPSPPPSKEQAARSSPPGSSLLVLLVALFFFLYAGVEHSFGGWIPSYAQAMEIAGKSGAAYFASAFWASLTVGRLLAVPASARFKPQPIVAASLVGALISVALVLVWPGQASVLWLATLGLGLSLAAIVPTTLALVGRRIGTTSQATAWFFVGLGTGKMTIPWMIGQFFESAGPQSLFVVMGLVLLAALGLFAGLGAVKTPPRDETAALLRGSEA